MEKIRVILADDHAIVRTGIRNILQTSPDIQVIAEASNGKEALDLVYSLFPDVLILDMEMPVMRGIEVAQALQAQQTELPILALSAYEDRQFIIGMLANGASGYISKSEAPDMIISAVRGIARGEGGWVSPRVAARLAIWLQMEKSGELELNENTWVMLQMFLAGKSNEEIASAIQIPVEGVEERLEKAVVTVRRILEEKL